MGTFYIDCQVTCTSRRIREILVPKMLVDSGSELTWISEVLLRQAGVKIQKRDVAFQMANGQTISRSKGYAIVRCGSFETVDEVVFGSQGDLTLLGARTLEGFGALVDARLKGLVASGPHPAAFGITRRGAS